jgi:IS605 OrfB family transposase
VTVPLRDIARPFVVDPAAGVCIRTRLKALSEADANLLRLVGSHLGRLASADLAQRVRDGLEHDKQSWANRKRALTAVSSARWAGSITKASHDQWGLARRARQSHIQSLRAGIQTVRHRLSLPIGEKGTKRAAGGYRSRQEWFQKSRRLAVLAERLAQAGADRAAGRVTVVRGGKRLLHKRHQLAQAGLTQARWREQWEAARWFLSADGESGKRFGNETIRVTPDGEVSLRLPAPLAHLANAPHGRYVLTGRVCFAHRGAEWTGRVAADRAVAHRIRYHPDRDRWYLDASWQRTPAPVVPIEALRTGDVIGVDMNAGHLAAWRLDRHGNPAGAPRTFTYDLSRSAGHRDAQVRHAISRLLRWADAENVRAIAVEDLDFTSSTGREHHGRNKRFRQLVSGIPTAKLRARLLSMATEAGISIIAVDPAYTSKWGREHWHKPLRNATHRLPVTTPHPWRSGGAHSDTGSGVAWHRPHPTRAMARGIGPRRPGPVAG